MNGPLLVSDGCRWFDVDWQERILSSCVVPFHGRLPVDAGEKKGYRSRVIM
jgi:hypothetical protein